MTDDIVQRLEDKHAVDYSPLAREAAETIKELREQIADLNKINDKSEQQKRWAVRCIIDDSNPAYPYAVMAESMFGTYTDQCYCVDEETACYVRDILCSAPARWIRPKRPA